ncbi:MAG: hypothetical protein WC627_13315 [Legionella sp.]
MLNQIQNRGSITVFNDNYDYSNKEDDIDNFLKEPVHKDFNELSIEDITRKNAQALVESFKQNTIVTSLKINTEGNGSLYLYQLKCITDILTVNPRIVTFDLTAGYTLLEDELDTDGKETEDERNQINKIQYGCNYLYSFLSNNSSIKNFLRRDEEFGFENLCDALSKNKSIEQVTLAGEYYENDDDDGYIGNDQLDFFLKTVFNKQSTSVLRELTLDSCSNGQLGNEIVTVLSQGLKDNLIIKSIHIIRTLITDDGALELARFLANNTQIENFTLVDNLIGNKGFNAFGNLLLTNHTLRFLALSASNSDSSELSYAALAKGIKYNTRLKTLSLGTEKNDWQIIPAEGYKTLLPSLKYNSTLAQLLCAIPQNVDNIRPIHDQCQAVITKKSNKIAKNIDDFMGASDETQAEGLHLENVTIGSSWNDLIKILGNTKLKTLRLFNNSLTNEIAESPGDPDVIKSISTYLLKKDSQVKKLKVDSSSANNGMDSFSQNACRK